MYILYVSRETLTDSSIFQVRYSQDVSRGTLIRTHIPILLTNPIGCAYSHKTANKNTLAQQAEKQAIIGVPCAAKQQSRFKSLAIYELNK